jgi:hypothetical protein
LPFSAIVFFLHSIHSFSIASSFLSLLELFLFCRQSQTSLHWLPHKDADRRSKKPARQMKSVYVTNDAGRVNGCMRLHSQE